MKKREELQRRNVELEMLRRMIRSEKGKMEIVVENITEGVVLIDQKGEVAVINSRARQMLGLGTEEEASSMRVKERLDTLGLRLFEREYQEQEKVVAKDVDLFNRMGTPCIARCQVSPVRDEAGNPLGVALVLADVTQQREADQMKSDFVSIVSHELRTPLSIIKEGVALVLDGVTGALNPQQKEMLSTARANIDRLVWLISDLLDISKLEAGRVELKRKRLNLKDVVQEVVGMFAAQAKEKGLEIQVDLPAEGLELYADRDRLVQVFVNLVGNALKFTSHGTLRVSVKEGSSCEVECEVADTGIGISKEDLQKVFSKFQQFGRTAGSGAKGTGLGLSIVKQLVELHKGKVRVESTLGQGTTVTFVLPRLTTVEELFQERIVQPLKRAQESGSPLSCLLFDLKGLDVYGKRMEEQVKGLLRKNADMVLGENHTLLVILPETQRQDGLKIAERILGVFENHVEPPDAQRSPGEISYRLASFPEDGQTEGDLLRRLS